MAVMTEPQPKLLLACTECKRQYDATGYTPSSAGSSACKHCGADYTLHEQDLNTICSACMTRVSSRARYCHHCATPIAPQGKVGRPTDHRCPACRVRHKLNSRTLGEPPVALLECPHCAGIWLGQDAFRLVAERSRERTLPVELTHGQDVAPQAPTANEAAGGMRYRRCPVCRKYMNRSNYAKRSGVIIDACKEHGIWFDATELGALLRWIKKGGEKRSAAKDADEARARQRSQVIKLPALDRAENYGKQRGSDWNSDASSGLIGGLLGSLFDL